MGTASEKDIYNYIKNHSKLIEEYVENLSIYGRQAEGGIVRPVYSPEWLKAQLQLKEWMQEAGLQTRIDGVGNLYGRLQGQQNDRVIVSGSHLDTVKRGGKYDGSLGIITALCAIRFLNEQFGRPIKPLEVVALCEEEGSRFSNSFLGSRAIIGELTETELHSVDANGIEVFEAAKNCGFSPELLSSAVRNDIAAFLELHIEQGPVLEESAVEVGIVTAITGLQHLLVTFEGQADHAGTTPMDLRRDPLVAASVAITKINELALELGRPAVATVGSMFVEPNARNIVPATVAMTIDFRHSIAATKREMEEKIRQICLEAAAKHNCKIEIQLQMDHTPAPMSREIIELLSNSATELGISNTKIVSGAGHDSQIMTERFPTGMVFVPSRGGRSHSSDEFTPLEQILPGVAVLATAMYKLAY